MAHTNAHVHTTTHACTCNTQICMYIYVHNTTHTHMHTQHHVHAGWNQFSLYCKPRGSWQGCGEAPSGWGYSRPAEEGGKLCSSVNCSVMYSIHCALSIPHNIPVNIKFREHIQQIIGADVLGKKLICALEACTFSGLGTFFIIGQRILHGLKSKLQWISFSC